MLIACVTAIFLINMLFVIRFSIKIGILLNPLSVMNFIWYLFFTLNIIFASFFNVPSIKITGLMFVAFGLGIVTLFTYFMYLLLANIFGRSNRINQLINISYIKLQVKYLAPLAVAVGYFSYIIYWFGISQYIHFKNILNEIWKWKNLELSGVINVNNMIYFGKHSSIITVILALWYYTTKKRKASFFLVLYLILSLFYVRRDPIMNVFGVFFSIAYLFSKKKKFWIYLIIFLFAFVALFFFLNTALLGSFERAINSIYFYTAGNFTALQLVVDKKIEFEKHFAYQNTFYFVYSVMKYIDRSLIPPKVIKPNAMPRTPNTYTAFGDPISDGGIIGLFFYAMFVGVIIGSSIYFLKRATSFISVAFYSVVFSSSIRSFMNNTFGWLGIYSTLFIATIIELFFLLVLKRGNAPGLCKNS